MYLELSLLFLSAAVFVIVAVTVPLFLQLHKILKGLAVTQELLQKNLPAILQNLDEAVANVRLATITVNERMAGFSQAAGKVQDLLGVIMDLENVVRIGLRIPLFRAFRTAGAVLKGIRVFMDVYATGRRRAEG
jgi:hypothetical protein